MRSLVFIVLALGAGACVNDDEELPVTPQGSPAPGGGGGSAATITGRVCLVSDPRMLAQCLTTGAGGLTVTLTTPTTTTPVTTTAVTADNGTFTINTPVAVAATGATTFTVNGNTIVASSQPLVTSSTIPVISQDLFDQIAVATGINLTEATGTGTIIARVTRGGVPVSGVTVAATPAAAFGPFFDGTSPTGFVLNGTGAQGVSLLSGFHSGPVNLTFNDAGASGETTVGGVQVVNGGITFVEGVLP